MHRGLEGTVEGVLGSRWQTGRVEVGGAGGRGRCGRCGGEVRCDVWV